MREQDGFPAVPFDAVEPPSVEENHVAQWRQAVGRRSFLKSMGVGGAIAVPGSALLASQARAASRAITGGDIAILRFLAAAELIEADLWQQYDELGGVNGGNPAYMAALTNIDGDMPTYVHLNNNDEQSHAAFLNAYLKSKGAEPVNLDAFRTLPSSKATGAKQIGRLTSLTALDVDTSWYTRYRSGHNPDFGAHFPQAFTIRQQPAIPISDADTPPNMDAPLPPTTPAQSRMQVIACTAAFHFGYIEQGGSSLYSTLAEKGNEPRGASDRVEHRPSRGDALRHLAGRRRQRRQRPGRPRHRPSHRPDHPQLGCRSARRAGAGEPDLSDPVRVHQWPPAPLRDRAANAGPRRRRCGHDQVVHR